MFENKEVILKKPANVKLKHILYGIMCLDLGIKLVFFYLYSANHPGKFNQI